MSKKAQKNGRNHKKTGKKRAILPKRRLESQYSHSQLPNNVLH